MKKFICIILILTTTVQVASAQQCGSKKFIDSCSVFPENFILSKSRVLEIKTKKDIMDAVYSVILSKGTTYLITACENRGRMIVTLLDSKGNIVLSNYDEKTKKYYPKITFDCGASGSYDVHYSFEGNINNTGCGVTSLGFKKKTEQKPEQKKKK